MGAGTNTYGGGISGISLNRSGVGYTSAPTVTISGGGGSGATAVANMVNDGAGGLMVGSLTMTSRGTGYTSSPAVSFSGGGTPSVSATAWTNPPLFALNEDGTLWYLNPGPATSSLPFTLEQVGTDSDWDHFTVGHNHYVGLKKDGSLWGWGSNANGQLGQGTVVSVINEPYRLSPDNDWATVEASGNSVYGQYATLALSLIHI